MTWPATSGGSTDGPTSIVHSNGRRHPALPARPYSRLLADLGDSDCLVVMATDTDRQNRMLKNGQRDAALAEVVAAEQLLHQRPQPSIEVLEGSRHPARPSYRDPVTLLNCAVGLVQYWAANACARVSPG